MKTLKKTSVVKLVERFDEELKHILMRDLEAIKATRTHLLNGIKQRMEAGNNISVA